MKKEKMISGAAKKRSTRSSLIGLGCGCKDAKSVSVSHSASDTSTATPRRLRHNSSSAETTLTLPSTSSYSDDVGPRIGSSASTPSFSGLLRELGELEQSVMSLPTSAVNNDAAAAAAAQEERKKKSRSHRRVEEESVAVVKESEDPLGDFRRSMLQMIVEKEIVGGDELRELLRRFLALNSPHHHDLILRAFADIWDDVFAGYDDDTPDLIRHTYRQFPLPPSRRF